MKALWTLGGKVSQAARLARQTRHYNSEARIAYAGMVAADPSRAVPDTLRRTIKDYARDHLGAAHHSPWLEFMAGWRGEFIEGCIPDTYAVQYLVPYSNGPTKGLLNNTLARRVLNSDRFPDIGYVLAGVLYDRDFLPVDPVSFAKSTFADHPFIYVKQTLGLQGLGVKRVAAEDFPAVLARSTTAVLQYPIDMHADLVAWSPNAAATLRVTTVLENGPARAVAAYFRLGSLADTHLISKSGFKIATDMETGALFETGVNSSWGPVTGHPETGIAFSGLKVPQFREALAMVEDHHTRVPHLRYIGWDVGISKNDGPMLFEANCGHTGTMISEAAQGPIFKGLGWDKLHLR